MNTIATQAATSNPEPTEEDEKAFSGWDTESEDEEIDFNDTDSDPSTNTSNDGKDEDFVAISPEELKLVISDSDNRWIQREIKLLEQMYSDRTVTRSTAIQYLDQKYDTILQQLKADPTDLAQETYQALKNRKPVRPKDIRRTPDDWSAAADDNSNQVSGSE